MVSQAQKRATIKYTRNHYDQIALTVPKGQREAIKETASKYGLSLNAFIIEAIKEKTERLENE